MEYAKVLLSAYPNLARVIKTENDNYMRRCYNSAYFSEPTETFTTALIDMMEKRRKLIDLKEKLDLLFSRLTEEEKALIMFKYAGVMPKNKFEFSLRTYFRKQKKLLKKIETYLNYLNITEDVFKERYMDVRYFNVLSDTVNESRRKKNEARVLSTVTSYE
jgi:hypothetical protein